MSYLETLPDDVFNHILRSLDLDDLLLLQRLNHTLEERIHNLGFPLYSTDHPQNHLTLYPSPSSWQPYDLIRRNEGVLSNLSKRRWHALQIGPTWSRPVIPTLSLTPSKLILGVGGSLLVHPVLDPHAPFGAGSSHVDHSSGSGSESRSHDTQDRQIDDRASITNVHGRGTGRIIGRSEEHRIAKKDTGSGTDIIGISPLNKQATRLAVAQFDGTLQTFRLDGTHDDDQTSGRDSDHDDRKSNTTQTQPGGGLCSTGRFYHPQGSNVHTLSASTDGKLMMTTTSNGMVSLFETDSPHLPPRTFDLPTQRSKTKRAWSSLLDTSHPFLPPSMYVGVHGGIHIYPLHSSGLSTPQPSSGTNTTGTATPDTSTPDLHSVSDDVRRPELPPPPGRTLIGPEEPSKSSPYHLTFPPMDEPSVHNPNLLLSAWYDSHLRIHDLRTPSARPVSEFCDPWQWADGSAMYTATFFAERHVAGGGSRHGTVSLFDVRRPKSTSDSIASSLGTSGLSSNTGDGETGAVAEYAGGWSIFSPGGKGSSVYALQGEGGRLWGVSEKRAFVITFDGSGGVPDGILSPEARAPRDRSNSTRSAPYGWKGRGGKWSWTVRYNEVGETTTGYNHSQRGVNLFESLVAA